VRLAAWAVPLFPRPLLLSAARALGALAFVLDSRGRLDALENLRVAFRDRFNPGERKSIALASYQNFARTFMDLFWSRNLNAENWREHVRLRQVAPETDTIAKQRGAIWVTLHFGGFEFLNLAWALRGVIPTVIAQDFKNPALTTIFKELREQTGSQVVPKEFAMLRLIKTLGRKGHVALLSDLTIKPGRTAASIRCFGLQTCATILHATLARRLEVPVIPVVCLPHEDGTCEGIILPPLFAQAGEADEVLAQRCWDAFEPWIHERPECWMWMYKHWRYLPGNETDPLYPEYANANKAFAAMQQLPVA
jgi:lauroyl/myristoyl acyltransferase